MFQISKKILLDFITKMFDKIKIFGLEHKKNYHSFELRSINFRKYEVRF